MLSSHHQTAPTTFITKCQYLEIGRTKSLMALLTSMYYHLIRYGCVGILGNANIFSLQVCFCFPIVVSIVLLILNKNFSLNPHPKSSSGWPGETYSNNTGPARDCITIKINNKPNCRRPRNQKYWYTR